MGTASGEILFALLIVLCGSKRERPSSNSRRTHLPSPSSEHVLRANRRRAERLLNGADGFANLPSRLSSSITFISLVNFSGMPRRTKQKRRYEGNATHEQVLQLICVSLRAFSTDCRQPSRARHVRLRSVQARLALPFDSHFFQEFVHEPSPPRGYGGARPIRLDRVSRPTILFCRVIPDRTHTPP